MNKEAALHDVYLKLTERCNLDCLMCDIPRRKLRKKEMSTTEIKRLIDEIFKLRGKIILATGGEPTIRNDLVELIRYARNKNLLFRINTNGSLITKSYAQKLSKAGLFRAAVSLQGPKEIDAKIRGKGVFNKTIRAIKYLQDYGIDNIAIVVAVIKQNYNYLTDLVEIAKKLGIRHMRFQPYMEEIVFFKDKTVPMLKKEDILRLDSEIDRLIKTAKQYNITVGKEDFLRKMPQYFLKTLKIIPDSNCLVPFNSCTIKSNGDLYPCEGMSSSAYKKIGNITERPLSKLWISNEFNQIRDKVRKGRCPGCLLACYQS